jgi:hypothetical protein
MCSTFGGAGSGIVMEDFRVTFPWTFRDVWTAHTPFFGHDHISLNSLRPIPAMRELLGPGRTRMPVCYNQTS